MKSRKLLVLGPMLGAAALGFATALVCFSAWAPRPASAQRPNLGGANFPSGVPLGGMLPPSTGGASTPQPIAIQGLDGEHFVVASREPRLVQQLGREGSAQNMLVTVVTHYTVRGDRLLPIEHVHVPTGFRIVAVEE